MSRGQGLPISTIILAILGILVLGIIVAIFGVQIGRFGRAASECPGKCYLAEGKWPDAASSLGIYSADKCTDFETRLSGTYTPRNMPKDADPSKWRCDSCCIITG